MVGLGLLSKGSFTEIIFIVLIPLLKLHIQMADVMWWSNKMTIQCLFEIVRPLGRGTMNHFANLQSGSNLITSSETFYHHRGRHRPQDYFHCLLHNLLPHPEVSDYSTENPQFLLRNLQAGTTIPPQTDDSIRPRWVNGKSCDTDSFFSSRILITQRSL